MKQKDDITQRYQFPIGGEPAQVAKLSNQEEVHVDSVAF